MKTGKLVLLGSAIAAIAAWATTAWLEKTIREPESPVSEDAPLAIQWRAGSSQRYKVLLDSSIAPVGGVGATVSVDAVLEFRTLEAGAASALVGMRLSPVEMRVSGASAPTTDRALSVPFRVRFAAKGMPEAFEFPAPVSGEHRVIIENLVRTFQVAIEPSDTWLAEETHLTGTYEAGYVRSDFTRVEKTKHRYVDSSPAMIGNVPLVSSKESIRLDARHDWIAAMLVDERVRSEDPTGVSFEIVNRASLEILAESVEDGPLDAWTFVAGAAPDAPSAAESARARLRLSRKEAEEQLLQCLVALEAQTEGRSRWVHLLRDLLLVDDELPAVLLDAMRTGDLGDRTRADLYLAFELAGSPHAQAALSSVIRDGTWTEMDGLRAIVALGAVESPTAESVEMLWETAQNDDSGGTRDLATTAILALGTIGGGLHDGESASYLQLRDGLLDGARHATDPGRRAAFALALGNTADPALSEEIYSLLDDQNPRVRGAVARALGKLGVTGVADDLVERLVRETSGVVRASIAEALASWESPSTVAMESIRTATRSERDETARWNMVHMLARNLGMFTENREILEELLRSEPSKRIRQEIAEALVEVR